MTTTPATQLFPARVHPPRDDVPDGDTLLEEWHIGQNADPPLTYDLMAAKYNCSRSLIHKRIKDASDNPLNMPAAQIGRAELSRIELEASSTKEVLHTFAKLQAAAGDKAATRVLNHVISFVTGTDL